MLKTIPFAVAACLFLIASVPSDPIGVMHATESATATDLQSAPSLAIEAKDKSLSIFLEDSMRKWKKSDKYTVDYAELARDLALVSQEAPLARGPRFTGALLAALAFFEGAFLSYVDDGSCNSDRWRLQAYAKHITWSTKICDAGNAFSLWQIHPEGGVVFTANGEWEHRGAFDAMGRARDGVITGKMLTIDRITAIRVALAFVRKSYRVTGGLVGYTGEPGPNYPKARARERFVENWLRNEKP